MARYIERGPISLEKLSLEHDILTYTTKDGSAHEFNSLDFLALLTSHMPSRGESVTRYFGFYSCRSRGERLKLEAAEKADQTDLNLELQPLEPLEPKKRPSLTWAECMKRSYEIDPLKCPKCQSQMRIIAFVTDHKELQAIMKSQGVPKARAPPPIPKAPSKADLFDEIPSDDLFG